MFNRKKKKTGCETPEYRRKTLYPSLNLGWQPQYTSTQNPPAPPTSGSNAHKPNPNYIPPASVAKTQPKIWSIKLEDLDKWVKTVAQIGDVAYCYDHMRGQRYIYCYRKPDDNPAWIMIQPETLAKYFNKENKGEDAMIGTMNCTYETPCGWCTKWDKKCDKKIGPEVMPILKMPDHVAENILEDVKNRIYESCGVSENLIKENKND